MNNKKEIKVIKKPIPVTARQVEKKTIVETIEGPLTAQPGDWIITGVDGEEWPVKKEIFDKTYEVIDD